MYFACKELKLDRGVTVAAGQPIPSAVEWPHHIRKIHLELGWIKEGPDVVSTEQSSPTASDPVAVTTTIGASKKRPAKRK